MAGLFCIFIVMTALGGLASSYFDALNDCDDDEIRTNSRAKNSSLSLVH